MAVNNNDAVNMPTAPVAAPSAPQSERSGSIWLSLTRFLREIKIELKKTSWPTGNELIKYTVVVMMTIISVAVFLFVADLVALQITRLFEIAPK